MSLDEIREALADRRLRMVAQAIGVHHATLYRIRDDKAFDPRQSTVEKLAAYLAGKPQAPAE